MIATFVNRHRSAIIVLPFLSLLSNCALYSQQAFSVRDALLNDQIDLAYTLVEKQHGRFDKVLRDMNKGMLQRMQGEFVASNESLEKAKQRINKLYGVGVTEQLGSVVINDAVVAYKGARFEQLLLHAYMAMNYIDLGDLDAARVEMLQADVKMREWGDQPDDDPFIKYLSALIYEALDEDDQAIVAYRYAMEAYIANRENQNLELPDLLVSDFIRLLEQEGLDDEAEQLRTQYPQSALNEATKNAELGELIVVLSHGLAPIKLEHSITTFSDEIEETVRIALPVYGIEPKRLNSARIVIDSQSSMLVTVENVDGLARQALDEEMPLITARAIARAILKHKSQHNAKQSNNSMGGFLLTVTNLITERADTRSWSTLPQVIQMSRHRLPAGEHDVDIELVNNADYVVDRIKNKVLIKSGNVTFIFKHWVSPRKPVTTTIPEEDNAAKDLSVSNGVSSAGGVVYA